MHFSAASVGGSFAPTTLRFRDARTVSSRGFLVPHESLDIAASMVGIMPRAAPSGI